MKISTICFTALMVASVNVDNALAQDYERHVAGMAKCPDGLEIATPDDCKTAWLSLGMGVDDGNSIKAFSDAGSPCGCFTKVDSAEFVFNTGEAGCKGGDYYEVVCHSIKMTTREDLEKEIKILLIEKAEMKSKIEDCATEKESLSTANNALSAANAKQESEIVRLLAAIQDEESENEVLSAANDVLSDANDEKNSEIVRLSAAIEHLQASNDVLSDANDEKDLEIVRLSTVIENAESQFTFFFTRDSLGFSVPSCPTLGCLVTYSINIIRDLGLERNDNLNDIQDLSYERNECVDDIRDLRNALSAREDDISTCEDAISTAEDAISTALYAINNL